MSQVNPKINLETLSDDALWSLREHINTALVSRITARKRMLDDRLTTLLKDASKPGVHSKLAPKTARAKPGKRFYPAVKPKYRNPKNHAETWAGRGLRPRWLTAALKNGAKVEDFAIRRQTK